MPVTVHPAGHPASEFSSYATYAKNAESLLKQSHEGAENDYNGLIQSSFQHLEDGPAVCPEPHGFVMAAVNAYSNHLHLIIRPEDVWFAILTQLSFYINEHAEELRGSFVSHEGQKELEVVDNGTFKACDFSQMAVRMASLIEENLVDPTIREWVQPSFTTTTPEDVTVASVIMMGALKKYFSYKFSIMCGLPSVTLLGEKQDWEDILQRLERIKQLGEQPADWYRLLVPVVNRFIESFNTPDHPHIVDFWQKIAHYSGGGSGPTYLSGWITAFCFWSNHGKCMYKKGNYEESIDSAHMSDYMGGQTARLFLSGVPYHRIDSDEIPSGYVSVPVKVNDNGDEYETMMVAGSVGMQLTSSGEPLAEEPQSHDSSAGYSIVETDDENGEQIGVHPTQNQPGNEEQPATPVVGLDTLQPVTGWFIYEVKPKQEEQSPLPDGKEPWFAPSGGSLQTVP